MSRFNNDIKLIATDFDGVVTDGFVYYSNESLEEIKRVSFKDIMGMSLAVKNGYKVAIISGERNKIIDRVANKFNLEDVHQGIKDKLAILLSISEKYSLPLSNICYLGDDINDIPVLEKVGLAVTVPDANCKVKDLNNIYITTAQAGNGAFREVVDLLLDRK
ncbi:MAG: acylneuraminate cytidylyltransferase [uncultured bacterium]|nr:MAG: acylneuraminate cytidylyltransferase [uncultured bacterium]